MFWVFALEVPTGAVADFFGRKYSLALGAFVFAIGVIIYGILPNFTLFLIGELILAAGLALRSGADEALIYDSLKEEEKEELAKKILGRSRSIDLLAIGLSAPVGSYVASLTDLNVPMLLTSVSMMIAMVIALSFREPQVKAASETKRYLTIVKSGFVYVKNHRVLKKIALDGVLVASSAYFVIWTYQRLLQNLNIDIVWFGSFHLLLTFVQVAINNIFPYIESVIGSAEKYLRGTAILVGLGFVGVGIDLNFMTFAIFILISGGFGLTRTTHLSAHINHIIESHNRATVLSFLSTFRRFFLVFLNPVVGYSIDKSLPLTMIGLGAVPILVGLFSPVKDKMLVNKGIQTT